MTDFPRGADGDAKFTDTPDMEPERFTLQRPLKRDRHIKPKFDAQPNTRQGALFTGANCLPGQLDLFE